MHEKFLKMGNADDRARDMHEMFLNMANADGGRAQSCPPNFPNAQKSVSLQNCDGGAGNGRAQSCPPKFLNPRARIYQTTC